MNITERLAAAEKHEAERTRLYERLIAAQLAEGAAKRAYDDAQYAAKVARETLEDFESDQITDA